MVTGGGKGEGPSTSSAFFANVPYTTSPGYLRKIFSKVGKVQEVELFTDSYGSSIGAGVVFFDSPTAAERAVNELHDSLVDNRAMLVKPNERAGKGKGAGKGDPQATVFFNGAPYDTTEGFLRAKFERCGKIVDFDLWRRPDRASQGMGTCQFAEASDAERAISTLNGTIVDGRRLLVQVDSRPEDSEPRKETPKGWGGKGAAGGKGWPERRVFWSNAPEGTSEGYLRGRFEQIGTIVDFDFWRRPDGTSLGMGVCEFDHYLGAQRATERLHGLIVDGSTLLVKPDDGGKGSGKGKGGKGKGGKSKDRGRY